jgi:hypothetical protein
MGRYTLPLSKATPIGRNSHRHRTLMATQTMVQAPTQHGHRDHPLPGLTRPITPRKARLARGGRTKMERRGFSTATPAWLHTRRGAIGCTFRTPSHGVADLRAINVHPPVHPRTTRYKLRELDTHAPWTFTMTA